MSRHQRPWRRGLGLLVLFLVIVAVGTALSREARTVLKILLLLPDLFPNVSLRPLVLFSGAPIVQEVTYPSGGETIVADLFRPAPPGRHGAVILTLGVNPLPRGDAIVQKLADGLARLGIVVLLPESVGLRQGRIEPEEIDHLVNAVLYLGEQDFVDPQRIGYAGFCVGASLALLAASDGRIQDKVAFVNAFGPYYDTLDLVRAIVTRRLRWQGQEEPWFPQDLTLATITRHLIEGLERAQDRQLLQGALLEREQESLGRLGELSPEGRLIYRLLTTPDPQEAEMLLAQLPRRMGERLQDFSPRTRIARVKARIFVMHDRRDTFIPYVESRRLVADLTGRDAVYTEFSLFEHVQPTRGVDPVTFLQEAIKLIAHLYRVLLVVT